MALVVLLRGVNVGGHRTFRPAVLAGELAHLGVVNIGAAGTFVIRQPVTRTRLRAELARRLPFETDIVMCEGREILGLMSGDHFAGEPMEPDMVRFVTVLSRLPRPVPAIPMCLPASGRWLVKLVTRENRFVVGVYRRHMKTIGHLATVDRLYGVPVTTRNWNTMSAIAVALRGGRS